jgi:hypothetical protein
MRFVPPFLRPAIRIVAPAVGALVGMPFFGTSALGMGLGAASGSAIGGLITGDNRRNILRSSLLSFGSTYGAHKAAGSVLGMKPTSLFGASTIRHAATALPFIGAALGGAAHWRMQQKEKRFWDELRQSEHRPRASEGGSGDSGSRYMDDVTANADERMRRVLASTAPEILRHHSEGPDNRTRGQVIQDVVERATEDRTRTGGYWSGPVSREWISRYGSRRRRPAAIRVEDVHGAHQARMRAYGYT